MSEYHSRVICRLLCQGAGMYLLLAPVPAMAAPNGADLLQACNQSLRDGFDSMIGKMCTWYVTPCDCNIDKSIPMVCLPESVTTETLAGLVIQGLTERPDLQQLDATRAAASILSQTYPCTATDPGTTKD